MSRPDQARAPGTTPARRKRAGATDLDELGEDPALLSLAARTISPAPRPVLAPPPPAAAAQSAGAPPSPTDTTAPSPAQQPDLTADQPVPPLAALHPDDGSSSAAGSSAQASLPELDPLVAGPGTQQATVAVSPDVARRFRRYQDQLATKGERPTNGAIVFAALNASQARFAEIVAERQPQPQEGQLFGAPVPGRRATTEAKLSRNLTYRPTPREKALIAELAKQSGASMAAFIDAVLDDYLTRQGLPPSRSASHA
jgi:hypothetical protein